MNMAALANNAAGIRLLCEARCNPHARDILGYHPIETCCGHASLDALEELLLQGQLMPAHGGRPVNFSQALSAAMGGRGGRADLVARLLELKADVNEPWNVYEKSRLWRLWVGMKTLQHKYGKVTKTTRVCYHCPGATPLMTALIGGQFEGAAALIAAGARLDLRNCRNRTAADVAKEQSVPYFVRDALEGRRAECARITAAAVADVTGLIAEDF
ncbi:Ank3 [Symbiodinium natans]|uniref:Ank3 protein n=1 Tax=Symbiodinium natans TaxID=878477 RepID=A0A812LH15_9DINO|nr:Ank3 [Symbiodinium natans]